MLSSNSRALDHVRIGDCMHHPILSCDPETPIIEVAARMSEHGIHAVAIAGGGTWPPMILSALDVMAAIACEADDLPAGDLAASDHVTASAALSLREAAGLMSERSVTHLLVVDPANGHPVGVLSTTDVLAALATLAGSGSRS